MTAGLEQLRWKMIPAALAIQNSKKRSKQLCGSIIRIWELEWTPTSKSGLL